jgi:hypothetical protein
MSDRASNNWAPSRIGKVATPVDTPQLGVPNVRVFERPMNAMSVDSPALALPLSLRKATRGVGLR